MEAHSGGSDRERRERAFLFSVAVFSALIVVTGFGLRVVNGETSFTGFPWWFHVHAIPMASWIALVVAQSWLAWKGNMSLHRQLGWIGAALAILMVVVGWFFTPATGAFRVSEGAEPTLDYVTFLLVNICNITMFGLMVLAAVLVRRRTEWHRRLMLVATILVVIVAWFRVMGLAGLEGEAQFQATRIATFVHFGFGIAGDWVIRGRPHPAWFIGIAAIIVNFFLARSLASSPIGEALANAIMR